MISKVEKIWLLVRANYCCEYCKKQIREGSYQVDHIFPESQGGLAIESNLAISCERCNRNKADNIEWIDPFSGVASPIYHPRKMAWDEHFAVLNSQIGKEIIGQSRIGRATASLIFKYTSQHLPTFDLHWDKLEGLQKNASLYQLGNHLRFLRLQNDFGTLNAILNGSFPPIDATELERKAFEFARNYLLIEVCFTRSRNLSDINQGIKAARKLIIGYAASSVQARG